MEAEEGVRTQIKEKIKRGVVESRDKKMCILFMERGRNEATHLNFSPAKLTFRYHFFEFAAQVQVILCTTEEHSYSLLTRMHLTEMYMIQYIYFLWDFSTLYSLIFQLVLDNTKTLKGI